MPDLNIPPEILAASDPSIEPVARALDEAADGNLGLLEHPALGGWTIETVGSAAWAMARVIEARKALNAVHEMCAAWHKEIHDYESRACSVPSHTIDFFTPRLEAYALAIRESNPKIKRVELPNGRIQTRQSVPSYAVTDENALLDWCKANLPIVVEVVERVPLGMLKHYTSTKAEPGAVMAKVVDANGEVIPGVYATLPEPTATVTPDVA